MARRQEGYKCPCSTLPLIGGPRPMLRNGMNRVLISLRSIALGPSMNGRGEHWHWWASYRLDVGGRSPSPPAGHHRMCESRQTAFDNAAVEHCVHADSKVMMCGIMDSIARTCCRWVEDPCTLIAFFLSSWSPWCLINS